MKKILCLFLAGIAAIISVACRGRETESVDAKRLSGLEEFKKMLPADIQELEIQRQLPGEQEIENGAIFENPRNLGRDSAGNIYVCDSKANCIFKFDQSDRFVKRLGRRGQGPGEFLAANMMAVGGKNLVVSDPRNGRIQFLDFEGNFVSGFKTFKGYLAILADSQGNILTVPRQFEDVENALIEVLDKDGILQYSFGKPNNFRWDSMLMNSIRIDVDQSGDIYVASRFLAKVQRYSSEGKLRSEFDFDTDFLRKRESQNLKIARDISMKDKNRKYLSTIESIRVDKNGFYILSNFHCPIILRCDQNGRLIRSYYYFKPCLALDFVVQEEADRFYLLINYPAYSVDRVGPKKILSRRFL